MSHLQNTRLILLFCLSYRECYLEKFKKYFEVEFFDGSNESPLDEDQIHDNPMWVQDYLATAQPSLEKKHFFVC